jgi:sialate O-acetylesterase
MKLFSSIFIISCFLCGLSAEARILLPQILSRNMVLQRDQQINIWGFAAAGEKVTVRFAGQTRSATTDQAGNWAVKLSPLKTSWKGSSMVIAGSDTVTLKNILVGEVWICSGQSNMEYAMRKLAKIPKPLKPELGFPADEVAKASNDQIRIFLVNRKTLSKPDSLHKSWSVAKDSALRAFSAAGYFFAREVQEKLGVPVGMISSAVPGSAIEPWIPKEAFEESAYFKNEKVSNDPAKFYTTMIAPLAKFSIRGFLWYQGETNCFLNETLSYAYKMKSLISSWRKAWKNDKLPFYYVQIAPYQYSKSSGKVQLNADTEPQFWEAQEQLLRLPHTGMVSTNDLNDAIEDLHPTYKWEIGRRLALWALAKTYQQDIACSGPIFKSVSFKTDPSAAGLAMLEFDHVSPQAGPITGFTICGKDGVFVDAEAHINEGKVIVAAAAVKEPVAVRYNWTENPSGNFFSNGLPALPFRTNNPLNQLFNPR